MDNKSTSKDNDSSCSGCQGINWWATLVVAILAVPCVGILVSLASGTKGMMAISVFIITCWVCTYLGMRLMQNPKMSEKIDLKKKP